MIDVIQKLWHMARLGLTLFEFLNQPFINLAKIRINILQNWWAKSGG